MRANYIESLQAVLVHEGGFVNNPKDPGGMTNLGCTKATWEEYCGKPVDEKTMRGLTVIDVMPLYKTKYWDKICCDDMPMGIDYVVFDAAINSGPGRAAKWLQSCIGVTPDGSIGPKTLAAIKAKDAKQLVNDYCAFRLSYLKELPTWNTFGKGWERRVKEVNEKGLSMSQKILTAAV
jgi:lysozyme family protein